MRQSAVQAALQEREELRKEAHAVRQKARMVREKQEATPDSTETPAPAPTAPVTATTTPTSPPTSVPTGNDVRRKCLNASLFLARRMYFYTVAQAYGTMIVIIVVFPASGAPQSVDTVVGVSAAPGTKEKRQSQELKTDTGEVVCVKGRNEAVSRTTLLVASKARY